MTTANMDHPNLDILNAFDESSLPDLDVVVLGALERFAEEPPPSFPEIPYKRPLIVGSGNALTAGRILFAGADAVFADESTFETRLLAVSTIDGVVLVSASGGKHATPIAKNLTTRKLPVTLFTNNPNAPARQFLPGDAVIVFPKNREPYTYNTSTYLSMILAKTREDPAAIHRFLIENVAPTTSNDLARYDAFFITVPPQFDTIRELLAIKFDELFGAKVSVRAFTSEQAKHSKNVVPSETEAFMHFGRKPAYRRATDHSFVVPLPKDADFGAMMAIGYYLVGQIQKQHPPYFKDNISVHVKEASEIFGQEISIIVE